MLLVDASPRCNACHSRLKFPRRRFCSECSADLANVGMSDELQKWEQLRQKGRRRYIWTRGIPSGSIVGALWGLGRYLAVHDTDSRVYAIYLAVWIFGGYLLGRSSWKTNEQKYLQAVADQESTATNQAERSNVRPAGAN